MIRLADPARGASDVGGVCFVFRDGIETEHDVRHISLAVADVKLSCNRSQFDDFQDAAVTVLSV